MLRRRIQRVDTPAYRGNGGARGAVRSTASSLFRSVLFVHSMHTAAGPIPSQWDGVVGLLFHAALHSQHSKTWLGSWLCPWKPLLLALRAVYARLDICS
jgi:hypothetical protein